MFHVMYKNICHWPKRGEFALFLRQPVRETRDRCTSGSLIYRGPEQTDRETCCEFFTGRSFSPILPLPPRPPLHHIPFRNSYKRRNTSNLDSRLKNWKTIFSVVLERLSKYTLVERCGTRCCLCRWCFYSFVNSRQPLGSTFSEFVPARATATSNPFKHWWKLWRPVDTTLPWYQPFRQR